MLLQIYGYLLQIMVAFPAELVVIEQCVEKTLKQLAIAAIRVVAQHHEMLCV